MSTASFIVVVEKATGVRNAGGMTATSDPYAKISTPTAPAVLNERTEVVQNNLNPVWDCCMLVALPASVPAMLKLEVFDSNTGTLVNGKDVSAQQTFFLFPLFFSSLFSCKSLPSIDGFYGNAIFGRCFWATPPLTSLPARATLTAGPRSPKCSVEMPRRKAP
jgi:hypothetical protein